VTRRRAPGECLKKSTRKGWAIAPGNGQRQTDATRMWHTNVIWFVTGSRTDTAFWRKKQEKWLTKLKKQWQNRFRVTKHKKNGCTTKKIVNKIANL
jgi:hypothetical protein